MSRKKTSKENCGAQGGVQLKSYIIEHLNWENKSVSFFLIHLDAFPNTFLCNKQMERGSFNTRPGPPPALVVAWGYWSRHSATKKRPKDMAARHRGLAGPRTPATWGKKGEVQPVTVGHTSKWKTARKKKTCKNPTSYCKNWVFEHFFRGEVFDFRRGTLSKTNMELKKYPPNIYKAPILGGSMWVFRGLLAHQWLLECHFSLGSPDMLLHVTKLRKASSSDFWMHK